MLTITERRISGVSILCTILIIHSRTPLRESPTQCALSNIATIDRFMIGLLQMHMSLCRNMLSACPARSDLRALT